MSDLKLFDYEKQKDDFFINRINSALDSSYNKEDLYDNKKSFEILRKLTAKNFIIENEIVTELLGELITFIEDLKNQKLN